MKISRESGKDIRVQTLTERGPNRRGRKDRGLRHIEGLAREFSAGKATVQIYQSRQSMGEAAAKTVARKMMETIRRRGRTSMVFASAPSQEEFLAYLSRMEGIEWSKVIAFHLDEYIGLPAGAPQSFGRFLAERLFCKVKVGQVYYLDGNTEDPGKEASRYAGLLRENSLNIACVGIGENGHIAFNDPHVADFYDPLLVKVVELDGICRQQQVNDGCFASIDEVPARALTLTMSTIYNAECIFAVVPAPSKAEAVRKTVRGPISTSCPASVLRKHQEATIFLDQDSSSLL